MNGKTLLKGLIGTAFAAVVFGGALIAGSGSASADSAFSIGAPALDGNTAVADKDSSSLDSRDIRCARGSYVFAMGIYGSHWGTYPSISNVILFCKSSSGVETSVSFGETAGSPVMGGESCEGEGGFVIGLRVNHDNYIKDFKNDCGRPNYSGSGSSVTSVGYGDWYLDRVENNDTQSSLVCDDSTRVMTGMRIRYKEDSNEIALTKVQLYCSVVTIN